MSFSPTVSFNVYSDPGYTQYIGNYPATFTGPGSLFSAASMTLGNVQHQAYTYYIQHVDQHGFTRNLGPVTISL